MGMSQVAAVSRDEGHHFSKTRQPSIRLLPGLGVEGDAHLGVTVQHRSRVARDPSQPNLRQVHLIQAELFDDLAEAGFTVAAGELGENITTRGLDLLDLPTGTLLRLGERATVEVTGLRNPCHQIESFQQNLLKQMVGRDERGEVVFRAGVMAVVHDGGEVRPGDGITVELPVEPHRPLERV